MTTALTPILTAFWDHPQSWKLATYEAHDGYRAWRKALGMAPADIITAVKDSSIRGRGGAGFPTGMKWSFMSPVSYTHLDVYKRQSSGMQRPSRRSSSTGAS